MKLVYDATGWQRTFETEDTFYICKPEQEITLSRPAYRVPPQSGSEHSESYFSVKAVRMDTGEPVLEELSPSQYTFISTGSDDKVLSDLINAGGSLAASFDPKIVQHITITLPEAAASNKIKLVVNYHAACADYLDTVTAAEITGDYDGDGPRYSPALMKKVLDRLDKIEKSDSSVLSMFGTAMSADDILDEDITGLAPENYVKYELHDVNTSAGINIIQPSKGSFYPTNLQVIVYEPQRFTLSQQTKTASYGKLFIYSDTEDTINQSLHISVQHRAIMTQSLAEALLAVEEGEQPKTLTGYIVDLSDTVVKELKLGVDYTLEGIDIPRTARSTSSEGVYQYIRFIKARIGEVLISYQAFGGFVAAADIRKLHQDIKNTSSVLSNTDIITADKLVNQAAFVELNRRLRRVEDYHNHFEQVEHRVSISNPGFHWFNIAALYDVIWGTPLSRINDVGQFRIQSALHKWCFEFIVDVDTNRKDTDIVHIKTLGTNQYAGLSTDDTVKALFRDNVAVRLCWVDDGVNSGVVLQIGWDFRSYHSTPYTVLNYMIDTDTIVVTNKSGSASMWTLLHDPDKINYPSAGQIDVWQHHKYTPTTDRVYQPDKAYYIFRDTYIYVRTADKYFVANKQYYTYSNPDGTGYDYYEVNAANNQNVTPGGSTEIFIETDEDGHEILNLFERALYGHFPVQVQVSQEMIGQTITESLYEITDASYDDTSFTMPNKDFRWKSTDESSKSCVKMIEPEDGIIAWAGNLLLSEFAPNFGSCETCPVGDKNSGDPENTMTLAQINGYVTPILFGSVLQNQLKSESIHGASAVVFDRYEGRYLTCKGIMSCSETGVSCEIPICLEDLCFATIDISDKTSTAEGMNAYVKETITVIPSGSNAGTIYGTEPLASTDKLLFMTVKPVLGTMSIELDRFELRQIRLHF